MESLIQKSFYRRIKQELQKANPSIENLLLLKESTNHQQQQFNEFVLKYLARFINNHKCYEEGKETFANSLDKNRSSRALQHQSKQMNQAIENNRIRAYIANFAKIEKELRESNQSIRQAELSLRQLMSFDFEDIGFDFNKKISKIVQAVNIYQQFISNLSQNIQRTKLQNKKQGQRFSREELPRKFCDQMRKIQFYVMSYFQGLQSMQILKSYQTNLKQLELDLKAGLKQNIDVLCKHTIKKRAQIQDTKLILSQIIETFRLKKQFPDAQLLKSESTNLEILKLFRTLKKEVDNMREYLQKEINLLKFIDKNQPTIIMNYLNPMNWLPNSLRPIRNDVLLKDFINKIYNKLPKTNPNHGLFQKMKAIQERIEGKYYSDLMNEEIQEYSSLLNQFVLNCFFYFEVKHNQNINIHQDIFKFAYQDLITLNKEVKVKMKEKTFSHLNNEDDIVLENQQYFQGYQLLTQSVIIDSSTFITGQKQFEKEINQMNKKETQITQLTKKYKKTLTEFGKAKQENAKLKEQIKLNKRKQPCQGQKYEKEQKIVKEYSQLMQNYKQLRQNLDQAQTQIESFKKQNYKLKQQNQFYLNQKLDLKTQLENQKQRMLKQYKSLQRRKQTEIEEVKRAFLEEKQNALKKICIQYQKQKKVLRTKIQQIQEQYTNLKNKYYEQAQERLNRSMVRMERTKSKNYEQVQINTSFYPYENKEDQEDELDQIRRLHEQINKKSQAEIEEYKAKLAKIQQQFLGIKIQKENLQNLHTLKMKMIQELQQKLQRQQQQRKSLENKVKISLQDIEHLQKTIRQLQASIQTQNKSREPQRQREQNINQQNQISSNLPTLVHYTRQLFNVDIFQNNQEDKQKLVNHLQWYARSRIIRTQLVYKHDPKNKTNFHQYIDQVQGLALVIKTKHAILAGFYPGVFRDKELLNKGGLIVSVTNNNSYCLHEKKKGDNKTIYRGMIYDTFFAIYGNAQIRIKTGFKTVFSNFGVSNSYFNSRGDRVDKLLNEGDKREVQFQYCEFYQVSFEKQEPNFR